MENDKFNLYWQAYAVLQCLLEAEQNAFRISLACAACTTCLTSCKTALPVFSVQFELLR